MSISTDYAGCDFEDYEAFAVLDRHAETTAIHVETAAAYLKQSSMRMNAENDFTPGPMHCILR
jgi:hypothetical protein